MGDGRGIAAALRFLHINVDDDPDADVLARELAFFLVARAESRHAGWRVLRQAVLDAGQPVPWERCARRAVPRVTEDLLHQARTAGRMPLAVAQHVAARHRAAEIAPHVDAPAVLKDLGVAAQAVEPEAWTAACVAAVGARSREQLARIVAQELGLPAVGAQEPLFAAGGPAG